MAGTTYFAIIKYKVSMFVCRSLCMISRLWLLFIVLKNLSTLLMCCEIASLNTKQAGSLHRVARQRPVMFSKQMRLAAILYLTESLPWYVWAPSLWKGYDRTTQWLWQTKFRLTQKWIKKQVRIHCFSVKYELFVRTNNIAMGSS